MEKKFVVKEMYLHRRWLYHTMYLFVFLLVGIISYIIVTDNIIYINGEKLMTESNVIITSTDDVGKKLNQNIKYERLGIFAEKSVQVEKLKKGDIVYSTFELSDLKPYTTYNYVLSINLEGIVPGHKITVGSQLDGFNVRDTEVSEKINLAYIDLNNSNTFTMGKNNRLSIPIEVESNTEGKVYLYVGVGAMVDKETLDYKLSDVRLERR